MLPSAVGLYAAVVAATIVTYTAQPAAHAAAVVALHSVDDIESWAAVSAENGVAFAFLWAPNGLCERHTATSTAEHSMPPDSDSWRAYAAAASSRHPSLAFSVVQVCGSPGAAPIIVRIDASASAVHGQHDVVRSAVAAAMAATDPLCASQCGAASRVAAVFTLDGTNAASPAPLLIRVATATSLPTRATAAHVGAWIDAQRWPPVSVATTSNIATLIHNSAGVSGSAALLVLGFVDGSQFQAGDTAPDVLLTAPSLRPLPSAVLVQSLARLSVPGSQDALPDDVRANLVFAVIDARRYKAFAQQFGVRLQPTERTGNSGNSAGLRELLVPCVVVLDAAHDRFFADASLSPELHDISTYVLEVLAGVAPSRRLGEARVTFASRFQGWLRRAWAAVSASPDLLVTRLGRTSRIVGKSVYAMLRPALEFVRGDPTTAGAAVSAFIITIFLGIGFALCILGTDSADADLPSRPATSGGSVFVETHKLRATHINDSQRDARDAIFEDDVDAYTEDDDGSIEGPGDSLVSEGRIPQRMAQVYRRSLRAASATRVAGLRGVAQSQHSARGDSH